MSTTLFIGESPIAVSLFWSHSGDGATLTFLILTPAYLGQAILSLTSIDISSENWKEIFDQLKLDPGTKQLASHCYFSRLDESIIYLSMPDEKLSIFSGKHRKELQDGLTEFFGTKCDLFLESGDYSDESPNQIKEEEKKKDLINAQKEIEEDPNVQSLVEAFGAKVIESTIEPIK